jgi:hypothetical protein
MPSDMNTAKQVSLFLVGEIDPNNVDAVEDGFDNLAASGFRVPTNIPQHAFQIPPEVWSYSQTIAVFVGGIFAGAIKDVLKDRLAKLMERLLERERPLNRDEGAELIRALDSEGKLLGIPDQHRKRLKEDFKRVLKMDRDSLGSTAG